MKRLVEKKEKPTKVGHVCLNEGCTNTIIKPQVKYCSQDCRTANLHPGFLEVAYRSKYKPEFATTTLDAYLEECKNGNDPTLIPSGNSYIVIHNARIPQEDEYAIRLGVTTQAFDYWEKVHPEFAVAMSRLLTTQKIMLNNNGLSGRYAPTIAKLLLNVNHGMIEKKVVDNTHRMVGIVKHIYDEADALDKK